MLGNGLAMSGISINITGNSYENMVISHILAGWE